MTKLEFILELNGKLSGLPKDDVTERINFYSEMIDDRVEEGLSEEEAVAAIGTVDEIASQIIAETPLVKVAKEKIKSKRKLRAWEIVLLSVGSIVWLPLLVAAFIIIISLCAVIWSVVVSLWAVFGSLVGCCVGGIGGGVIFIATGNIPVGIAIIGAGIALGGLAIFAFFGCLAATKGVIWLTKKTVIGIKFCFVGRKEKSK